LVVSGLLIPVLTQLSDLYGRRMVFLLMLWCASIASFACSLAPTVLTFLICRLILGIGTTVAYSFSTGYFAVMSIMCCESVSVEFRSLIPVLFTITWVTGIMAVGLLRIWIHSWRYLYFIISIPSLFTISYYWLVFIFLIHFFLSACVSRDAEICFSFLPNKEKWLSLKHCNRMAEWNFRATMNISYWGMALLSTTLSEDSYTGYFLSGFTELPAGLLAVLLLQKFGRRSISMWSFLFQSLFLFLAVLFPGSFISFAVVAKLFNSFIWAAQPLLLAEMSPTTIRNTFFGAVQFAAEAGSISAPYLILLVPAVTIFSFFAALLLVTAPETRGRAMPEDLDQFDPGCFLRMFGFQEQRKRSILLTAQEVVQSSAAKLLKIDEKDTFK
uniref:MFS domain-containing protein n=1 Tax=Gongylonema pulchrum TaxID=637853 RepID=A0A183CWH1_9BILA